METMEKILAGVNKIIIDKKSGTIPYLPLPDLKNSVTNNQQKTDLNN